MKRKIISFCTILCLIFPCFFAVACKKKTDGEKVKAYSYSITLKNAKGKIDESTLADEYDYASDKKVAWQESDGNYTISVTRTSVLSGSTVISLLEGFDYSNLSLTVNGNQAEHSIVSGTNTDCADDAYLADRQFSYEYTEMKSDTAVVIDFSNCGLAKITLDVTNLRANNVQYYIVEDEFVTLEQAKAGAPNNFRVITDNTLVVDYGSVIAFDYSEQLVLNGDEFIKPQTFNYSTTGSRYFTSSNRVQYLEAQRSGKCELYSVTSDASKNGTLRVLSPSGLSYANSFEELELSDFGSASQEFEYFGGEMLSLSVYKADNVFIELSEDANKFNYYLVNRLDETLSGLNIVTKKTIEDTERIYLQLDLTDGNGSALATKYLIRKPIKNSDYFIVYATGMQENTRVVNADAIVIGSNNKPSGIPTEVNDSVLYYFENGKTVQTSIPSVVPEKNSNNGQNVTSVKISASNIDTSSSSGSTKRTLEPVSVNPADYTSITLDCQVSGDSSLYRFEFNYTINQFKEATFTVSAEELNLYGGENVYYSTTPELANSWSKLTPITSLQLTSGAENAIYYYIDSYREDAGLGIVNIIGENIGESNRYHDCFGRTLKGIVEVDGFKIDLARVKCLEIVSGYYDYNQKTAKITRNYDESYHNVNIETVKGPGWMMSFNGYDDADEFHPLEELDNFKIRYSSLNKNGEIYYYIDDEINRYLVLKDEDENIVSSTELVYNNGYVERIHNRYVYRLALNGSYYDENEEFTLESVEVSYNLYDENQNRLYVYTTNDRQFRTEDLYVNTSYFVACEDGYRLDVYNERGNKIIDWNTFIYISHLEGMQRLYLFTFEFPQYDNYEQGSKFILVKTAID